VLPNLYTEGACHFFMQVLRRLMPNYRAVKETLTSKNPPAVTWREAIHAVIGQDADRKNHRSVLYPCSGAAWPAMGAEDPTRNSA
jgi:hypothetical protein